MIERKVVRREVIELGAGQALFRKTYDDGTVDVYMRDDSGWLRARRPISADEWERAAAVHAVQTVAG